VRQFLGIVLPQGDESFPDKFPLNGQVIEGVPEEDGWIRVTSHGEGKYLVETKFLVLA